MNSARAIRFVRSLVGSGIAIEQASGEFRNEGKSRHSGLDPQQVRQLISEGILAACDGGCKATPLARGWLKRKLSQSGDPADQHRFVVTKNGSAPLNLNESPLTRLSISVNGTRPFLQPHHVESGERVRRLFERARMLQRTTMSYDPNRLPDSSRSGDTGGDLSGSAMDARRELARLREILAEDCASAVFDVCGYMKGLQTIELERNWPRRSAKLVLRVGLEQLASYFGLSAVATGRPSRKTRHWADAGARPHILE
jgi:Domain of unknown function (DUF6456)